MIKLYCCAELGQTIHVHCTWINGCTIHSGYNAQPNKFNFKAHGHMNVILYIYNEHYKFLN